MNKLFLNKTFKRSILLFSMLKTLSPLLTFLAVFPVISEALVLRLSLCLLSFVSLSLGTLSFYLSLAGVFLFFKSKDPALKTYIYSLSLHGLFFISIVYLAWYKPWGLIIESALDLSLGGPMLLEGIKFLLRGFIRMVKDPSFTLPFVQ